MNNKKMAALAIAVFLLLGITPIYAQIAGTWAGTGEGWCPFPVPYPNEYMKPWQNWKGSIPNTQNVFSGEWYDGDGNQGTFKSEILFVTEEEAYAGGDWYWIDNRFDPPVYRWMGPFSMKFKYPPYGRIHCYGEWQGHIPSGIYSGTMKGRKVD